MIRKIDLRDDFKRARDLVNRSQAATTLERLAREHRQSLGLGAGGRKPTRAPYTAETILTVLALLVLLGKRLSLANVLREIWQKLNPDELAALGLAEHVTAQTRSRFENDPRASATEYERLRTAFDRLVAPVDPSPHNARNRKTKNAALRASLKAVTPERQRDLAARRALLLQVCNALLGASLPPRPEHHAGDLAIDATIIGANAGTGGTGTSMDRKHGADLDAAWWHHTQKHCKLWGHALTLAVATHPLRGREVPNVACGMSLAGANGGDTDQGLEALDAAIANGWGPRPGRRPTLMADRGYTDKDGFAEGLIARGYNQSADYSKRKHRDKTAKLPDPVQHTFAEGPVLYNGNILCPAALGLVKPQHDPATGQLTTHPGGAYDPQTGQLRLVHPEDERNTLADTPAARAAHRDLQTLLLAHRMPVHEPPRHEPNGGRRGRPAAGQQPTPTHRIRVICPAAAGQLDCPHCPLSQNQGIPIRAHTPPTPDRDGRLPAACGRSTYLTLHMPAAATKRHQLYLWGTDDWLDRHYGSRSRNEQYHSQLGGRSGAGLDNDPYAVTGTARVALLAAVSTAVNNLRQADAYDDTVRNNRGTPPLEDRHATQQQRDRELREHHSRRTGKNTTDT